jgi:TolA-binding protein
MTDPNLLRKERQDEARRQQQADERVRELEEEVERLRYHLKSIVKYVNVERKKQSPAWITLVGIVEKRAKRALDGGGDNQ